MVALEDGWVVGSYGFSCRLPIGTLEQQLTELERWQVDEIAVIDISQHADRETLAEVLERLCQLSPMTPLLVGGGVRDANDASWVISSGADRVLLGSAAFRDPSLVPEVSAQLGDQAVVLSVPMSSHQVDTWLEPKTGDAMPISTLQRAVGPRWGGEILLMDVDADGGRDAFNFSLLSIIEGLLPNCQVALFGGFRSSFYIDKALQRPNVSAVCIGNACTQKELFVPRLKHQISSPVRKYVGCEVD